MSLIDDINFAHNREPRCPVILLLDTSYSMQGQPIQELNAGIQAFKQAVAKDERASVQVEVSIITFGGKVEIAHDFVSIQDFQPKNLSVNGDTPMGKAIEIAIDQLEARKAIYKSYGVPYYQPWLFLITDGEPTDHWNTAAQRVRQAQADKKISFYAVGVQGANLEKLKQIAPINRSPVMLDGLKFKQMFQWLSSSVQRVSQSAPGDQVDLDPISGWAKAG